MRLDRCGWVAMLLLGGCGTPGSSASPSNGSDGGDADGARPAPVTDASAEAAADAAADGSAAGDASPDAGPRDGASSDGSPSPPALPAPLRGVTVDDISNLSGIVDALGSLPRKPTVRIVFDETQAPAYYTQAVAAAHGVAYVMGEILDSEYVKTVTPAQYEQRTSSYLAAFPTDVDLWEVGNEINGNWLGTTADVVAKMSGAFDLVKAAGGRTELTLYGCTDSGAAYDMVAWAQANVPARMRTGLDYVLVSYYEGDCGMPRTDWTSAFQQLRAIFPTAALGFGEVGYVDASGNDLGPSDESGAAAYLQKYYGMQVPVPGYVAGYFWWYFAEDMVPKTQPLFGVLSSALP